MDPRFDPERLETDSVQLWTPDIMLTLIPREQAQQLVREKKAYVITGQAIGLVKEESPRARPPLPLSASRG